MTRFLRRLDLIVTTAIWAVIATVATITIPSALILIGGFPLPEKLPDWNRIGADITGNLPQVFWVKLACCIGWVAYLWFVWAAGTALLIRSPKVRAVAPNASQFVADIASRRQKAAAMRHGGADIPTLADLAASGMLLHTVKVGESARSIAERYYGDPRRWAEIRKANLWVTQDDGGCLDPSCWLTPGWRLAIPGVGSAVAVTAEEVFSAPPTLPEAVVHHVKDGETLRSISEIYFGDPRGMVAIFEANVGIAQRDGGKLDDDQVLQPGWDLFIPSAATAARPAARRAEAQRTV